MVGVRTQRSSIIWRLTHVRSRGSLRFAGSATHWLKQRTPSAQLWIAGNSRRGLPSTMVALPVPSPPLSGQASPLDAEPGGWVGDTIGGSACHVRRSLLTRWARVCSAAGNTVPLIVCAQWYSLPGRPSGDASPPQ